MIARPTANLFALLPTPARQIRPIAQHQMAALLQPDAPALKQQLTLHDGEAMLLLLYILMLSTTN